MSIRDFVDGVCTTSALCSIITPMRAHHFLFKNWKNELWAHSEQPRGKILQSCRSVDVKFNYFNLTEPLYTAATEPND